MEVVSEFLSQPYALWVPRVIVALLLVVGGIGKLFNLREFREIVGAYNVLPKRVVPAFSYSLPWVEVATGGALLLKILSPEAEFVAAGLFLVFAFGIGVNLLRGRREIPCGCFSGRSETISWMIVLRNVALASLALMSSGRLVLAPLLPVTLYGIGLVLQLKGSKPKTVQLPAKTV